MNNGKISLTARILAIGMVAALVLMGTAMGEVSREGLVAEWHFDGNAQDSSGNGNHGTINGATFVQGVSGQALSFDGVNDYVGNIGTVSTFSFIQNTGIFTIEGYSKIDTYASLKQQTFVSNTGTTVEKGFWFGWENQDGNKRLRLLLFNGIDSVPVINSYSPKNIITDNNWHHIAVTGDGTDVKFYVDGVENLGSGKLGTKSSGSSTRLLELGRYTYSPGGSIGYLEGKVDEVKIYNRALSADEIKAGYEADKSPPPSQLTPSTTGLPTTTVAAPPVSSSYILDKANDYKVLLDSDINLQDSANLSRGAYYVVSYNNLFPYASGIEVLSSEGKKITSESEVEPVFTSIAWKEASGQVKPSDIQTMKDILQTSKDIDSAVSPVLGVTTTTISSINSLKSACVSVPFVGKKCAWDAVSAAFPGISTLANELESLNSELNQWKSTASSVQQHLPNAINGIEQAKSGGDINPQLQSEISQSLSAFGTLQSKTNDMSGRLASVSSTLSDAESGVRKAADTPIVGSLISPVANAIGSMHSQVNSLKEKADSFSRNMGEQSAKLSTVTDTANKRNSELKSMWSTRQSAETKVYATLGLILILILIIVVIFVKRKKEAGIEAKKDEKLESKPSEITKTVKEAKSYQEVKTEPIKTAKANVDELKAKLEKTKMLLEKLDERFTLGEISEDHYNRLAKKYKDDAENLQKQITDKETS